MPRRTTTKLDIYFVTLTVVDWISIFIRRQYFDIIIENLKHCQQNKGLQIFSYCIMPNHLHLIASCTDKPLSSVLGDFKKYTAKKLIHSMKENTQESRKWMVRTFNWHGKRKPSNLEYQIWQHGSHPIHLYSYSVFKQKENYIHNNPVKVGFVGRAEDWYFSSANPESPIEIIQ